MIEAKCDRAIEDAGDISLGGFLQSDEVGILLENMRQQMDLPMEDNPGTAKDTILQKVITVHGLVKKLHVVVPQMPDSLWGILHHMDHFVTFRAQRDIAQLAEKIERQKGIDMAHDDSFIRMSEVRGTFEHINPRFTHNKLSRDAILVSNFMITMNMNVRLAGTSDAELEFGTQGGRDLLTNKYMFLPDPTRAWGTELVVDYKNGNQIKLTPDEINELIDIFEASLRREPSFEQTKFTIMPAPSYKLLKT
eukprot:m51a1_g14805 hypothetical protein (250) ;mRNA; r:575217-577780